MSIPFDSKLDDEEVRTGRGWPGVFEQGLDVPRGFALPICRRQRGHRPGMAVRAVWPLRQQRMLLSPGDTPVGYRLPLTSLPWVDPDEYPFVIEQDPFEPREKLPPCRAEAPPRPGKKAPTEIKAQRPSGSANVTQEIEPGEFGRVGGSHRVSAYRAARRQAFRYVFLPPLTHLEDYLDLIAAIERTAIETGMPVIIEGYGPPLDPRLSSISVTPDTCVIEVNMHPSSNWEELVRVTSSLYDGGSRCPAFPARKNST